MSIFKRAWKGEAKLWHVFWGGLLLQQIACIGFGIVLGLCIGLYASGAGLSKDASHDMIADFIGSPGYFALISLYYIWLSICVWRCSWNAGAKVWGYLARIAIILLTLGMLINIPLKMGKQHAAAVSQQNNAVEPATAPAGSGV